MASKRRENDPNYLNGKWLASPPPGEEIVIAGIAGRFANANNINELYEKLLNKTEMLLPDHDRWSIKLPELPERMGTIPDIRSLDAGYFRLSHDEAESTDCSIRGCMEVALEAIIDAGLNPAVLEGTNTGIYTNLHWSESTSKIAYGDKKVSVIGMLRTMLGNRLSHFLKLKGPSFTADTACSSTITTLDIALRDLRSGRCENAIILSTNPILHPMLSMQFYRLGVVTLDGVPKVFDQDASGYVRSEGTVAIFLQKAKNSKRIYSKIITTNVNCDGFKENGITFPSSAMQATLIAECYENSGIDPSTLTYIEAHGTGTVVGDTEEINAIDAVLTKNRSTPLLVGSVKSNVGHAEAAAGAISIAKVLLALNNGLITANANLKKTKKGMHGFEEGRLKPVLDPVDINDKDALIGINNFGFGGTNAHVVLQKHKRQKSPNLQTIKPMLVLISGRTKKATEAMMSGIAVHAHDVEYMALLNELQRQNMVGHAYRTYAIVSRAQVIESFTSFPSTERVHFYIHFGQRLSLNPNFCTELNTVPAIKTTLELINDALKDLKITKKASIDHDWLYPWFIQFAIADLFKSLDIHVSGISADYLGRIISAYFYNQVTLEEAVGVFLQKQQKHVAGQNGVDYEQGLDLKALPKNAILLNLSDEDLKVPNIRLDNFTHLLKLFGRLFTSGFNFPVNSLYETIKFPVCNGTGMISPFIKWSHTRRWHAYKYSSLYGNDSVHRIYSISTKEEEYKHLDGHVIDNRNLCPAIQYLQFVRCTLVERLGFKVDDVAVAFNNCRFIKASTLQDNASLRLSISVQKASGYFEIIESGLLICNGYISIIDTNPHYVPVPSLACDPNQALETDEIYKELYLRGYTYSGLFKGLVRVSLDASAGLAKWDDNWTAFIDTMLQLKILQKDIRALYVPTFIQRIIIDPVKQKAALATSNNNLLPVSADTRDTISAGGVEVFGLLAKAISRRRQHIEPILERHVFVPNTASLPLDTIVRVNTQIILENSDQIDFKAVEIQGTSNNYLLPLVFASLNDIPLINPVLVLSSAENLEPIPEINIEKFVFKRDSNLLLIIGSGLLQNAGNLDNLLESFGKHGFIITRERLEFKYQQTNSKLEFFTEYTTETEKIILLKKATPRLPRQKFIKFGEDLTWLPVLQDSLKSKETEIIVYAENTTPSGLLGFMNCLRLEPTGSRVRGFLSFGAFPSNIETLAETHRMSVVVFKENRSGTYRHLKLNERQEVLSQHSVVSSTEYGDLNSLKWVQGPLSNTKPPPGQIFIYPYYSALNFKDVMLASGRISLDSSGNMSRMYPNNFIGLEYSGTDITGKRYMGMAVRDAISTMMLVHRDEIWEIPNYWSLKDAATVPIVYKTVLYSLLVAGDLQRKSSILIHSATGGVGLAAINVCQYYECEIFLTLGTQEKRDYIKRLYPDIPDDHIGSSHTLQFEQMIATRTAGRGVDLVLNSLAEDKLLASVRCLAHGGKFLEIGKYDLENNRQFNILLLEKEASYHGIALDWFLYSESKMNRRLYELIQNGMTAGYIKPLHTTIFKSDEVVKAFRYMTSGKHIGKILIEVRDEAQSHQLEASIQKSLPRFYCDSTKSYVIIGGLGGVGLELTDWLVLHGAMNIVLSSRTGVQNGYQTKRIHTWRSYGVRVQIVTSAVTTQKGCEELLRTAHSLGEIDGIFNLAVLLLDNLFENQTVESFQASLAPKAQTTRFLDEITRRQYPSLRYFVIFSSVSCGLGNIGQTNYGMANSVMERICENRHKDGLPGLAIQWGAIGEVGLVAKMQKENQELVISGTLQQKIFSCMQALEKFLLQDDPVVSSMIVATKVTKSTGSTSIVEIVAGILGIQDIKTISQHSPLAELGMDSMMVNEFVQILERDCDMFITANEARSFTFAQLLELQNDQKDSSQKLKEGIAFFLQHVPDKSLRGAPIVCRLPSKIQEGAVGPAVFALPGVDGSVAAFQTLASKMDAHVYGIQYDYENPENTVEDFARNIYPRVEGLVPASKQFTILAYSFGCDIALELIHSLEAQGFKGRLIAIDGSPEHVRNITTNLYPDKTPAVFETSVLYTFLQIIVDHNTLESKRPIFLECKTYQERIALAAALISTEAVDKKDVEYAANMIYKRVNAIFNYRFEHSKIQSQVFLFKATVGVESSQDYGYSEICKREPKVAEVKGDHNTIIRQDQLIEAISKLVKCLIE